MSRRLVVVAAVVAFGCASPPMPTLNARYDAELDVLFRATLEATLAKYPTLKSSLGTRTIETAWHPVSNRLISNQAPPSSGERSSLSGLGGSRARYFIRFDIRIVGDRPWRVEIVGHASRWTPGDALPVPLKGAAQPGWVETRTNGLSSAIHERIKPYAVPGPARRAP